jgi:hypothetical protein
LTLGAKLLYPLGLKKMKKYLLVYSGHHFFIRLEMEIGANLRIKEWLNEGQ